MTHTESYRVGTRVYTFRCHTLTRAEMEVRLYRWRTARHHRVKRAFAKGIPIQMEVKRD